LNFNDIRGQRLGLLKRVLIDQERPRTVLIGPLGTGKTTILKRWAETTGAILLPRSDKPTFRKAVQKVGFLALDKLDQVDVSWNDLLVEAITNSNASLVATFDGTVEAFIENTSRSLRALVTPIAFSKLSRDDVRAIIRDKGDFDPELVDLVSECGSPGFALQILQATNDKATLLNMLKAQPGDTDPDVPTVHAGLISDALSALVKECRRGDVREVAYWATVLLHHYKAPVYTLVRQLVISAGEDHHCIEAYQLAQAVATTYTVIGEGWNQKEYVLRVWCLLASLPKWFDEPLGVIHEDHYRILEQVEQDGVKPIPSYALDTDSWTGRKMAQDGKAIDWRVSSQRRVNMLSLIMGYSRTPELGSLGQAIQSDENGDSENE